MKFSLSQNEFIETNKGIDISLPLSPSKAVLAWYCEPIKIWPVKGEGFIGRVSEGGNVNFNNIQFNPHGNGTHTENVGHISEDFHSINDTLTQFFFKAKLITITPKKHFNETYQAHDLILDKSQFESRITLSDNAEAIVIRTQPNGLEKKEINYSKTNPPYITPEAILYLNSIGIKHLLIDLPSVDREVDAGKLEAHRAFWNYPENPQFDKTITEMIYVPDTVLDDDYILNIQIISLENDASPSKPILYKIQS